MLDEQGASDLLKPKKRPAQLPLCNYKQESFQVENIYHRGEFSTYRQIELTPSEYKAISEDRFDRIVMNPPFENGADIKHIQHALTFLKPGGRLVALCVNGPRQHKKLKPMADEWEPLSTGSFRQAGTNVNVAMLVINAPEPKLPEVEQIECKGSEPIMPPFKLTAPVMLTQTLQQQKLF